MDHRLNLFDLNDSHAMQGYDLTEEPDFWPPVIDTPEGRRIAGVEEMP